MPIRYKDRLEGYSELPELSESYQREASRKSAPAHILALLVGVAGAPLAFLIRDDGHFLIYLIIYLPIIVTLIRWGNSRSERIKVGCPLCGARMVGEYSGNPARLVCHDCKTYAVGTSSD